MLHRLIIIFALFFSTTLSSQAGPWLREKGNSFVSFSLSTSASLDARSSGYFEFGITPTTTVGLDLGMSRNSTGAKLAYGTLFMRRALGPTDRPNKFAYDLGIGATYGGPDRNMIPHFKTGLSWGRGITLGNKGGWMTIESGVLWNLHNYEHVTKVDTTLGLNFTDTLAGILQLNLANQSNETFGFFEPSVVINTKKSDLKLQFGLSTPLEEPMNTSLKLGVWRSF